MLTAVIKKPLPLTAAYSRSFLRSASGSNFFSTASESGVAETAVNQSSWLTRLPSLVEGCDYEHWLVVMEAPKGYPLRDELVNGYVKTLAMALGSEEEAKKAMYSVSTKYYYGFGCKVPGILTYKIQSLPNVRWVLPDSYLCHGENNYGGEPFVDGRLFLMTRSIMKTGFKIKRQISACAQAIQRKQEMKRKCLFDRDTQLFRNMCS